MATSLESALKEWEINMNRAINLRSKTQNFQHVKQLHLVPFAKEQITFLEIAGVVLMLLTDLNG